MHSLVYQYLFVVKPRQAPREAAQQLCFVLNLHGVVSPGALLHDVHLRKNETAQLTNRVPRRHDRRNVLSRTAL